MNNIANPGDVKINQIVLYNKDGKFLNITNTTVSISIYEEIISPFMTAKILLSDSISISSLLPFVGEEQVYVDFETPYHENSYLNQYNFKKLFYVCTVENLEYYKDKNAVIQLQLISVDAFVNRNKKISKTFKGSVNEIVNDILKSKDYLGTLQRVQVDDAETFVTYTSNFWTPAKNIMYLTGEGYSAANNPNFVFFENKDGYNFLSLDTLYDQLPTATFIRDNYTRDTKSDGSSLPNTAAAYNRIIDISINNFFDYFDRVAHGMYGGSMYHYDLQAKKFSFIQRNTKIDYETGMSSLNLNSSINSDAMFNPLANLQTKIVHKNLFPNTVPEPLDIDIKRRALIKKSESFKINIRVFGKASYKIGDSVHIIIYKNSPADTASTDQDILDPLLSGNYLISALSHEISNKTHYCNIELIRDSYSSWEKLSVTNA